MIRALGLVLGLCVIASTAQSACGSAPTACKMPAGEYHIALPESGSAPIVVFLHGAGSNGANVMRNTGMVNSLRRRGYAVLAPTGARIFGKGPGRSWNFLPEMQGRDETRFLQDVVADAADRFDLNPKRVLLAGFSAGGFMVNYLACTAPDTFAAYAPVSGGFWRPQPERCGGPVRLFHTHGWRDATVPLEGRFLGEGRYQQGDIFAGLQLWRATNLCGDEKPSNTALTDPFWRRKWEDCTQDSALELALFSGGHQVPPGWADMVLDWFETPLKN